MHLIDPSALIRVKHGNRRKGGKKQIGGDEK